MSKPTLFILCLLAASALAIATVLPSVRPSADPVSWPAGADDLIRRAVAIPALRHAVGSHEQDCYPPRNVELSAFAIWPVEVPAGWWRRYRGEAPGEDDLLPGSGMSYDEARDFCRWMTRQFGVRVRLPTVDEWQAAARAGTPGVTYPWGWAPPAGQATYDAETASPVASHTANPWGLFDLAGNVAEWCEAGDADTQAPAMGGSWAERSDRLMRISHRVLLPRDYRGADVGFRIVVEHAAGD